MYGLPVYFRAMKSAASFASDPLFTMNERVRPFGAIPARRFTSIAYGIVA